MVSGFMWRLTIFPLTQQSKVQRSAYARVCRAGVMSCVSLLSVFSKALEGLKLSRTSPVGEWDSQCNGGQHACIRSFTRLLYHTQRAWLIRVAHPGKVDLATIHISQPSIFLLSVGNMVASCQHVPYTSSHLAHLP